MLVWVVMMVMPLDFAQPAGFWIRECDASMLGSAFMTFEDPRQSPGVMWTPRHGDVTGWVPDRPWRRSRVHAFQRYKLKFRDAEV